MDEDNVIPFKASKAEDDPFGDMKNLGQAIVIGQDASGNLHWRTNSDDLVWLVASLEIVKTLLLEQAKEQAR